jgi:hypothetical protein
MNVLTNGRGKCSDSLLIKLCTFLLQLLSDLTDRVDIGEDQAVCHEMAFVAVHQMILRMFSCISSKATSEASVFPASLP